MEQREEQGREQDLDQVVIANINSAMSRCPQRSEPALWLSRVLLIGPLLEGGILQTPAWLDAAAPLPAPQLSHLKSGNGHSEDHGMGVPCIWNSASDY